MLRPLLAPLLVSFVFIAGCATNFPASNVVTADDQQVFPDGQQCPGQKKVGVIDIGSSGVTGYLVDVCATPKAFNAYEIVSDLEELKKFDFDDYLKKTRSKLREGDFHFSQSLEEFDEKVTCEKLASKIDADKKYYDYGFQQIRYAYDKLAEHNVQIRGAATAAFRPKYAKFNNGEAYIQKVRSCLKENGNSNPKGIKVVKQSEEGELEFRGVVAVVGEETIFSNAGVEPIVWGAGSTSTQLTFLNGDWTSGAYGFATIDLGDGSVPFCTWVAASDTERTKRNYYEPRGLEFKKGFQQCQRDAAPFAESTPKKRKKLFNKYKKRKIKWITESSGQEEVIRRVSGKHIFGMGGVITNLLEFGKTDFFIRDRITDELETVISEDYLGPDVFKLRPTNVLLVESVIEALDIKSVTAFPGKDQRPSVAHGLAVVEKW